MRLEEQEMPLMQETCGLLAQFFSWTEKGGMKNT